MTGLHSACRAITIAATTLMLTTACQPGQSGYLDPQPGYAQGSRDTYDGPSVRLTYPGLQVDVSGRWTTRLEANTIHAVLSYRNQGSTPRTIDVSGMAAERSGAVGTAAEVYDTTGMDLADERTDNDDATTIIDVYHKKTTGSITVPPGQIRTIEVSIPLPEGIEPLDEDQPITVRLPTSEGSRTAKFVTASTLWF